MPSKTKKSAAKAPAPKPQTQAERFLEAIRKAKADKSGGTFARAMGKVTLARNARKTGKGEVGGSNV